MADAKITALTALTAITDDDLLVVVDDPTGTPVTKKATVNVFGAIRNLSTITGINAKTVATTTLYTVPAGKSLIITDIVVRVTAFTAGSKNVQAVVSYGGNDPNYNNFSTNITYTVTAVNTSLSWIILDIILAFLISAEVPIYAATTVFKINITTGSNATTETWSCDLFGYLIAT